MNWFRKLFVREAKYRDTEKTTISPAISVTPTATASAEKLFAPTKVKEPVTSATISMSEACAKADELGILAPGAVAAALNLDQMPESTIYVHGVITCVCKNSLSIEVGMTPGWSGGGPRISCPDCGTRIAIMETISDKIAVVAASIEAVSNQYRSSGILIQLSGISMTSDSKKKVDIDETPPWIDSIEANTPERIGYCFVRNELNKEEPDFHSFQNKLEQFSKGYEINNGWTTLVIECRKYGKKWLGNQCALKGLSYFPEPRVTTWDMIDIADDIPKAEILRGKVSQIYRGESNISDIAMVLTCLRNIYGEPGEPEKNKDELRMINVDM